MKVTIYGQLPGLNEYIDAERQSKYKAAALKTQSMQLVMIYAKRDLRKWRAKGPVYMRYIWYEPNRRRDKDNVSGYGRKIIQDALVKGGYLRNDGWNEIAGFSDDFCVNKLNPRVEVYIDEVEI